MTSATLTYADLGITTADVFEQMGCEPDAAMARDIEAVAAEVGEWLRPRYVFTVTRGELDTEAQTLALHDVAGDWGRRHSCLRDITRRQECLRPQSLLPQSPFRPGRIVTRQLRGAEAYALFICTAGSEMHDYLHRLTAEGDMVRLYAADALGSLIAERTADAMERCLQAQIDKLDWHRTNRFSPGYCGWHVSEQALLFPLFHGQTAGVALTPSCLMQPEKSVSGIIGVGPAVRYNAYTCGLCDYKDCYKRKLN